MMPTTAIGNVSKTHQTAHNTATPAQNAAEVSIPLCRQAMLMATAAIGPAHSVTLRKVRNTTPLCQKRIAHTDPTCPYATTRPIGKSKCSGSLVDAAASPALGLISRWLGGDRQFDRNGGAGAGVTVKFHLAA